MSDQVVAHNRWDTLQVPSIGGWTPTQAVSVVIPYYEQRDALERTLAGLSAQTYPGDLLQVVVADDGSAQPLVLPERHRGLDVTVVRQERRGFGAPRARNLGARTARGTILLFLDCDMIPAPRHVEAHARWHHAIDHAVTIGPRAHVDASGIDADTIAEVSASGDVAAAFAGRPQTAPAWIDEHLARTDGLTSADHDLFRVVASGNLGVSRRLFDRVGGFDASFDQWGGEDTELGYRLFVGGGLLVHDDEARCWHQGDGDEPDVDERVSLVEQRPKLAQLIAHHGFRRIRRGRTYRVPRFAVTVRARDVDAGAALRTVESVLASNLSDLLVHVEAPDDPQQRQWLERQLGDDGRVTFDAAAVPWTTPYRVAVSPPAVLGSETLDALLGALTDPARPTGVVYVTVPPVAAADLRVTAWSTRAVQRALLADGGPAADDDGGAGPGRGRPGGREPDAPPGGTDDPAVGTHPSDDVVERAASAFGRMWLAGGDVGVGEAATVDPLGQEAAATTAVEVRGELQALGEVLARLEPEQQKRLVEVARSGMAQLSPRQMRVLLGVGSRVLRVLGRLRRRG